MQNSSFEDNLRFNSVAIRLVAVMHPQRLEIRLHYRGKEYVMNAGDIRWLLQTIEDPETAERFVVAQYERGRISYHAMAEIAQERGWIIRSANDVLITATRRSTEYATAQ